MSAAERRSIMERRGHACPGCQGLLRIDLDGQAMLLPMIDEHIIALAPGGSNALSNRELRCATCAKLKTPCRSQGHRQASETAFLRSLDIDAEISQSLFVLVDGLMQMAQLVAG